MTADVPLLPLPPARLVIKHDRGPISETQPFWNRRDVSDYARACVAHATTARDARIARLNEAFDARERMLADIEQAHAVEIEALRAEVDRMEDMAMMQAARAAAAERGAERLAEALRDLLEGTGPACNARIRARAALHPTAAQENDACHHINTVRGEDGVRWCQHCRQQLGHENDDA